MKVSVLFISCIIFSWFSVLYCKAQLGPSEEELSIITEFETSDFHPMQYGVADNVHSPVVTFHGNTYFIWITKDRRPKVGKIDNGNLSTAYLDKDESEVYQTSLDGHNKYSIGVDQEGYIHIAGDMHNYHENQEGYISRYSGHGILYWKSAKPESVDSFLFVGDGDERIPGHGFTYLSFTNDYNGVLFARYRSKVAAVDHSYDGENAWSLAQYDVYLKRWSQLGVLPPENEFAENNTPLYKTLFWESMGVGFNPHWEQSYQNFGKEVEFDFNNRMHVTTVVRNIASNHYQAASDVLYAYSDNRSTFYRADGTQISSLPMRADEGGSQADVVENENGEGYSITGSSVTPTLNGDPVVSYSRINSSEAYGFETGSFKYWDKNQKKWSAMQRCPVGGLIRHKHLVDVNGIFSFIDPGPNCKIRRYTHINESLSQDHEIRLQAYFRAFDRRALREQNVIRGFHFQDNGQSLKIIRIESKPFISTLDSGWVVSQLGSSAGEAGTFNNILQLQSSGKGMHEGSMDAQFVHKDLQGNGSIIARVINVDYHDVSSFGGVMISDNHQSFMGSVISYVGIRTWSKTGDGSKEEVFPAYNEPAEWFKIERIGDTINSYHSDNGKEWKQLSSGVFRLSEEVQIGLISGSGSENTGHARIDNIKIDLYPDNKAGFENFAMPQEGLSVVKVLAVDDDGNTPENTLDSNFNTRWSSEGSGKWIELELVGKDTIKSVWISWYKGDERSAYYDVLVSDNHQDWETVLFNQQSGEHTQGFQKTDLENSVVAKHVRIVGYGNSENSWNSITEIRVIGEEAGKTLSAENPFSFDTDKINVYPNPCASNSVLHINRETLPCEIKKVDLINFQGNIICGFENVNNSICLPDIQSGSYFLRIFTGDFVLNKKILVQNM